MKQNRRKRKENDLHIHANEIEAHFLLLKAAFTTEKQKFLTSQKKIRLLCLNHGEQLTALWYISLFQDFGWPKLFPHRNLIISAEFSDSSIEPICFISFFPMVFSVDGRASPPWTWCILIELQHHSLCYHKVIWQVNMLFLTLLDSMEYPLNNRNIRTFLSTAS